MGRGRRQWERKWGKRRKSIGERLRKKEAEKEQEMEKETTEK